jgi:hypothetical protein
VDTNPESTPLWLADLILGPRLKSNGAAGGHWTWPDGWGQKKLDEICKQIEEARSGGYDRLSTRLCVYARWFSGGAYDVDKAWARIEEAIALNPTLPTDWRKKLEIAFKKGISQPEGPPENVRVEVLPASQYYGECAAPIPPALVKGILPQTGVATIGGQSGTGKSFQAIHLGVRLIPDCDQRHYIDKYQIKRQGGVLYLVLEGKPAFPLRVTAAFEQLLHKQLKFGDRFRLPFCWNTYQPSLFDKGPEALLRLATREQEEMRREFHVDLVAIFLDTMGLAACYENENMAAQVQRVVSGLSRVSDETGALCINVDHMGKDADAGMRGTSAKRDCVETILGCFCDRDKDDKPANHRMQLLKIRDGGDEGRVIPYSLQSVDMGVDEDHAKVTTAVIRWEPNRSLKSKGGRPKKEIDVNLALAIKEVGLPVEKEILRAAFYKQYGEGRQATINQAWNRAIKEAGVGAYR